MLCCRILVFILLVLSTTSATCSLLLPLFRRRVSVGDVTYKEVVLYWYTESITTTESVPGQAILRYNTRDWTCDSRRLQFSGASVLAIIGTVLGGIAVFISFAHLWVRPKCCLCSLIMVFTTVAFVCFVVCLAIAVVAFTLSACDSTFPSYRGADYDIAEGAFAVLAATVGYLLSFLFELCS